ncbi:hypothetical protein HAV21_10540 [Paenarthrobacter sp. MSM-2-10-13]|uniref:hypothetical protein n=1 Tax=Paenarthrobacter sp. MSM-2-10-13 TaxID=2717318 RepID=UPI0014229588|nr:hypothetical protein [Paenarthrobacter sp. MSM-2-10-13]NHW47325.1 hypothetical protein [Paenarthrobacter sp. MSM-2-10-13]
MKDPERLGEPPTSVVDESACRWFAGLWRPDDGLEQAPTVTDSHLVRAEQTAEAAALLDAAELQLAVQHRFVLSRFNKADAEIIAELRVRHFSELQEAEAVVASRLASPAVWMRGATRAYSEAVPEPAEMDVTLVEKLVASLKSLMIVMAALATVVGLVVTIAPAVPACSSSFACL